MQKALPTKRALLRKKRRNRISHFVEMQEPCHLAGLFVFGLEFEYFWPRKIEQLQQMQGMAHIMGP